MLRVRSVFTGVAGTPWYSNLYFDNPPADAQACVTAVDSMWNDYALAQLDLSVSVITENTVPQIDPVSGDIIGLSTVAQSAANVGTQSGQALPPATQVCASLRTGAYVNGREVRGKIFFPGLTISAADSEGRVSASTRGDLQANVGFNLVAPTAVTLVVWSRKAGTTRLVTGVTIPSKFAVLRSRRD